MAHYKQAVFVSYNAQLATALITGLATCQIDHDVRYSASGDVRVIVRKHHELRMRDILKSVSVYDWEPTIKDCQEPEKQRIVVM